MSDTCCRECIFSEREGITQTGCEFGQIKAMMEAGINVIGCYDEESEFYVCQNVTCLLKRPEKWKETYGPLEHSTSFYKDKALKETEDIFHAIVFFDNNIKDLKTTIGSLYKQKLIPSCITVVRKFGCNVLPSEIIKVLERTDIKYKLQNPHDDLSDEANIDLIVSFNSLPYYSVFHSGYKVSKDFYHILHKKIVRKIFTFGMLTPDEKGNGMVVARSIHKAFHGNMFDKSLRKKLEEDGWKEKIIPIEDIIYA